MIKQRRKNKYRNKKNEYNYIKQKQKELNENK